MKQSLDIKYPDNPLHFFLHSGHINTNATKENNITSFTMMPPSDSLRHHLHKLAEVRADRNTSSISTPTSTSTPGTAPPPYTLSVTRPSGTTVMSIDQNDMDDPWDSPINIYIDNSITVTGDENTITVSSPGVDSPTDPTHMEAQASPRLSSIAAVIIAALNRANVLHDDMGYPRPVNVRALAGIRVNGRNNNICVGCEINKSRDETADTRAEESNGRKRRASSVRTPIRKRIFKKFTH
ncbi:unnamed protein product [Penicillium egyptiacum]|uniref:Uncharacterized protein n=1 Tax=Penicillium egyptiacum TaxID=1303716 RepID=A0A9W4KDS0_9EURO|nr:unnamed protein product [Penicillium egyptiacum]